MGRAWLSGKCPAINHRRFGQLSDPGLILGALYSQLLRFSRLRRSQASQAELSGFLAASDVGLAIC